MCCSAANIYPALRNKSKFGQIIEAKDPIFYANAFSHPLFPFITAADPDEVQYFHWGLIPSWCKTVQGAEAIQRRTINARSETVFEKRSFAASALARRGIVPVSGFFEWHDQDGKKYPFFISIKGKKDFALAGIWNVWKNPETGDSVPTFSILTTAANPQMEKIHNLKKRMPVILNDHGEKIWLDQNATVSELKSILKPYDGPLLAYPVRKISPRSGNNNRPETLEPYSYPDLIFSSNSLF